MMFESPNFESAVCTPLATDAWELAETEVRLLSTYESNWDGDGADPVPDELIESVLGWLKQLRATGNGAPAAVSPLAGGTVMLEWHYPEGEVVSVEVREPGKGEVLVWSPHQPKQFHVIEWGGKCDVSVRLADSHADWDGASDCPFAVAA